MDQQVKEQIENSINNSDVCLFMKGSPEAPQCGFSMAVSNILKIMEVKYQSVDVLKDQKIREGIKVYSEWPTIPQLYIKKEFIGGCDIITEMAMSGELDDLLTEKKIKFNSDSATKIREANKD